MAITEFKITSLRYSPLGSYALTHFQLVILDVSLNVLVMCDADYIDCIVTLIISKSKLLIFIYSVSGCTFHLSLSEKGPIRGLRNR